MMEKEDSSNYILWNEYDADGTLAVTHDKAFGGVHYYQYDVAGRLEARNTVPYSGSVSSVRYQYDNQNRLTGESYIFDGQTYQNTYSYGPDSRLSGSTMFGGYAAGGVGAIANHTFDSLGREYRTNLVAAPGQYALVFNRTFVGVTGQQTTTLVNSYTAQAQVSGMLVNDTYTYDDNGNITSITDKDGRKITYRYDGLNQLIWENNQITGKMLTYSYDAGGNMVGQQEYPYSVSGNLEAGMTGFATFSYGNSVWKDLLTAYKGQSITYDQIGNPLAYRDGMTMTWDCRQLKTLNKTGLSMAFQYDADGRRVKKTVNGTATAYWRDTDGKIMKMQKGSDILLFLYEGDGRRVGFLLNGTGYYYVYNAQGDVVGLIDKTGTSVVQYSYDSWGRPVSVTGSLAATVGQLNPFRYRGYEYDAETGLYYLLSRYYDPMTMRFVNADEFAQTGSGVLETNMFAYCLNNPINHTDPHGKFALALGGGIALLTALAKAVGVAALAAIGAAAGVVVGKGITDSRREKEREKSYEISPPISIPRERDKSEDNQSRIWMANYNSKSKKIDIVMEVDINTAMASLLSGSEQSFICSDYSTADKLTAAWRKTRIYEIDRGKENVPGYYRHFHLDNRHGNPHIWHY